MTKNTMTALCILMMLLILISFVYLVRNNNGNREEKRIIVACVGDSITYGSGVRAHRGTQSYPARLQQLLGDSFQVLNYGLPGRTLLSSGDRPYIQEMNYRKSQAVQADIYILMLGTNDSKPFNWNQQRYRKELSEFVQRYKETARVSRVILMQPPKAFSVNGKIKFEITDKTIANEIHNIIAETGKQQGCEVLDLYELTKKHPEWYADGVHPNERGNREIAEVIAKKVRSEYP